MDVKSTFHRLWIEHVMWTRAFLVSTISNLDDSNAVTKRLLQNPVDFANVLRPYYGDAIAASFQTLFTEHLLIAAALVKAAIAGDTKEAEEQRKKWYANADEISYFLQTINPYWHAEQWRKLFYHHLSMTEKEATLYMTKQYEESIAEYDNIQQEALIMADYMTYGIRHQFYV